MAPKATISSPVMTAVEQIQARIESKDGPLADEPEYDDITRAGRMQGYRQGLTEAMAILVLAIVQDAREAQK